MYELTLHNELQFDRHFCFSFKVLVTVPPSLRPSDPNARFRSIHRCLDSHLQSKEFDPDSDSECEEQESPPQTKITTLPVSTCSLKQQNVTFFY